MRVLPRVLVVAVLCLALLPAAPAGAVDPRIKRSQDELLRARTAEQAAVSRLDRAVAEFEEARLHLGRLRRERVATRVRVDAAQRDVASANARARERVTALYMQPHLRLSSLQNVMGSDSVGEALHRYELVDQIARSAADNIMSVERAAGRVEAAEREELIVTSGIHDALRRRRASAKELAGALELASQQVATADRNVEEVTATVARERAARRAERARRRAEARERARLAAVSAGSGPLPSVDGRTCPIGAPNAFTDTWGAPRSGGRSHQGVDIFAVHGMPLYAVEDGTVRTSDNSLGGVSVHLDGVSGDAYYYAHLSSRPVTTGQQVRRGDVVGAVGNTGNARSTPPHLHFQFHPGGGAPVNPTALVTALCR